MNRRTMLIGGAAAAVLLALLAWAFAPRPVEVEADSNGEYTPPEGWDGTDPHLTEAAGDGACPTPIAAPTGGRLRCRRASRR